MAWRVPPITSDLDGDSVVVPEGSRVPQAQKHLLKATRETLKAIAEDVRAGLKETVGVGSSLAETDRASVVLELPPDTDTERIARAVDMENIEAWRDADGRVHVGIGPWYSTKDVDQLVLSIIKVVHVMLGLHAAEVPPQPRGFLQKALTSVAEVLAAQKRVGDKKD